VLSFAFTTRYFPSFPVLRVVLAFFMVYLIFFIAPFRERGLEWLDGAELRLDG